MAHQNSTQITDLSDIRSFMLAGKAKFTLVSKATQRRVTYKIVQKDEKPAFVSVMDGSDNINDYTFFGTVFSNGQFRTSRKSKVSADAKGVKGFEWAWKRIDAGDASLLNSVEFWHEGSCCKCGKTLTVPESIESGWGPVCAKRAGKSTDTKVETKRATRKAPALVEAPAAPVQKRLF